MVIRNDETNLRVFNAAKKFAEEILFPLMDQYQNYQRQSDFGAINMSEAIPMNEEIRDIERYNGLKGMVDTTMNLALAIKSTVHVKGNKEEREKLEETIIFLEKIKLLFYDSKHLFFNTYHKNTIIAEEINREYFEKVKKIIQSCYVNTEILMTRNKLLFTDSSDEFASDEEIMEEIKKEYVEG